MKNFTSGIFFRAACSLSFAALLCTGIVRAQSQNALSFDGLDDYVSVPNASGLINAGTGISLSCWVFPTNAFPVYPDYDGFAGIRNESDGDFYLVQIDPSPVIEARFRNAAGIAFTLRDT